MPLYESQCEECGETIEVIQKFSDPPLSECEKCGGKLERLLSAPAVQFKGTGWYVTDYGRKNGKNSESPPEEKKKITSDSTTKDSSGSKKNKTSK